MVKAQKKYFKIPSHVFKHRTIVQPPIPRRGRAIPATQREERLKKLEGEVATLDVLTDSVTDDSSRDNVTFDEVFFNIILPRE